MADNEMNAQQLLKDFSRTASYPSENFLAINVFCCGIMKKARRYRQLLRRADARITRDLDIRKLIRSQSIFLTAVPALLNSR